jgi:predicted nucleotidyltransferase
MDEARRRSVRRFFIEHPELGVAVAYLFGSHAEDRAHRESDIDIAVLLDWEQYPSEEERFQARVRLSSELISVLHHNEIDLVILNDVPALFGRKIVWDGIVLFVGDPQAQHDFVRDVQILAADLEPWLRRMERIKLEALAR